VGLLDSVKGLFGQHKDKADHAIDKTAEVVDDKTGGKHTEHIDKAVDAAQQHTGQGDTTRS
jgi:MT0933-like antitoxin protein